MPCCVGCIALFAPRVALVIVWLASDYLGRAYESVIWPLLGFVFLPLTTLAYAFAMNSRGSVAGVHLVLVVVAVLADLGLIGGSSRARWRES